MKSRLAWTLVAISPLVAAPPAVSQSCWHGGMGFRADDIPPYGDGQPGDLFGAAVSTDAQGPWGYGNAVVGAPMHDHSGSKPSSGSAYMFERIDTAWYPQVELLASDSAAGDRFGCAVACSDYRFVVGADANQVGVGKAYVFTGTWPPLAEEKLIPLGGGSLEAYGAAVDICDPVGASIAAIVVGAPLDDYTGGSSDGGSAFLFEWNGASWVPLSAPLRPSDPSANKQFGGAVAVDGDLAVVGAHGDAGETGAAYVFQRIGGAWSEVQKLTASGGVVHDRFGSSVSIAGGRIVVGAPGEDPNPPPDTTDVGAVYVFESSGGTWTEVQKLEGDSLSSNFGVDVSIWVPPPGLDRLAVGDHQRIHMYGWDAGSAQWTRETAINGEGGFGNAVAVAEHWVITGDPTHGGGEGSAPLFFAGWGSCIPYCFCPLTLAICGNADDDAGCANVGGAGASLSARGTTYPDTLTLDVRGATPNSFALFFQGDNRVNGGNGLPFNDGRRCAGGNVQRIRTKPTDSNGDASYGPYAGDPAISSQTDAEPWSGIPRTYQAWYRDPGGPCGTLSNTTNGFQVYW